MKKNSKAKCPFSFSFSFPSQYFFFAFLVLNIFIIQINGAKFSLPSNVPTCLNGNIPPPPSSPIQPVNGVNPTCFDNPLSPVKQFTLVLQRTYIPGYPKGIITVNGTSPGPTLVFNQFDIVQITVINNLDNDTSLHFHGLRQFQTPGNDGFLALAQCPIPINSSLVLTFCADRTGSSWYHGHRSQQYGDGLYGAYIVKPQNNVDIYSPQYTYDIPVVLGDWYNVQTDSLLPWFLSQSSGGIEPVPDNFIVNGRFNRQLSYAIPYDAKVRFRFISACSFALFNVSIDGFPMTIIEVDGTDTVPYETNAFALNVAQRVSVLVDFGSLENTWVSSRSSVYIRAFADVALFDADKVNPNLDTTVRTSIYLCKPGDGRSQCNSQVSPGLVPTPGPLPLTQTLITNYLTPLYVLDYDTPVFASVATPVLDFNQLAVKPLYSGYTNANTANCYTNGYYSDIESPSYLLPFQMSFASDAFGINRGYWNGITLDMSTQYSHLYQQPLYSPMPLLYDLISTNYGANQPRAAPTAMTFAQSMNPNDLYISIETLLINNGDKLVGEAGGDSDASMVDADSMVTDPVDQAMAAVYRGFIPNNNNNVPWQVIMPSEQGQYMLPGNVTIEILLLNADTGYHPIHIHGYAFWIIATSEVPVITAPYLLRDIITLKPNSWARVRIVTDNPGVWGVHCHISWHMDAGLAAVFIDNVPALQTNPKYSINNIGDDALANCAAYNPPVPIPPVPAGGVTVFVDNDFKAANVPPAEAAKYAFAACIIIMMEAFLGLAMYKMRVLEFMLPELICMNIGTLVGAVFIEFINELYTQVFAKNLTYVRVATIMCIGFLFPLITEKLLKRGQTNKFAMVGKTKDPKAGSGGKPSDKKKSVSMMPSKNVPDKSTKAQKRNSKILSAIDVSPAPVMTAPSPIMEGKEEELPKDQLTLESHTIQTPDGVQVAFHVESEPKQVKPSDSDNTTALETRTIRADSGLPSSNEAELLPNPLPSSPSGPPVEGTFINDDDDLSLSGETLSPPADPNNFDAVKHQIANQQVHRASVMLDSRRISLADKPAEVEGGEQEIELSKSKKHRRGSSAKMEAIAEQLAKGQNVDWNLIFIILAGEIIDTFVDGGIIAAAFLAGTANGLASSTGVFMEELPHMTGSFAVFVAAGAPLWKCVLINMFSAFWLVAGAAMILGLTQIPGVDISQIDYLLAFASGTYLYVAMVDLTPLITYAPWPGWARAISNLLAVCFGIGVQAAIAVYHWKSGTG